MIASFRPYRIQILVVAIAVLSAMIALAFGVRTQALEPNLRDQLSAPVDQVGNDNLYLVTQAWDGINRVLVFDPTSRTVIRTLNAGYYGTVRLTANRSTLYVYHRSDNPNNTEQGVLSALDTQSGSSQWQVTLPGTPFSGVPTSAMWLSVSESFLYLEGSPDGLHPHIYTVDTQRRLLQSDWELPLPYPANASMAFPQIWKLPWTDSLAVASRDQLFLFDPSTGRPTAPINLLGPDSATRTPLNLPSPAGVWDGAVDVTNRRLYLSTSTQEILMVDFASQTPKVTPVVSLPGGWQFAVLQSIVVRPQHNVLYVQLKQQSTQVANGLEVEEVWGYDISSWKLIARLDLRQLLGNPPATPEPPTPSQPDLTDYGFALSANGSDLYTLPHRGLILLTTESDGRLIGSRLNATFGEDFSLMFGVP